jgi:hypothetical protein
MKINLLTSDRVFLISAMIYLFEFKNLIIYSFILLLYYDYLYIRFFFDIWFFKTESKLSRLSVKELV